MSAEFKFKDNAGIFLNALPHQVERALNAVGLKAESYAKVELSKPKPHKNGEVRPNVKSGRLRNSISHTAQNNTVYIGTSVEYARYVELGTSRSPAYPYLKPAATQHGDEYKEIVKNYLKNG